MSEPLTPDERDAFRYLDALDAGDLDAVAQLWEQAAADPDLARQLGELTDAAAQELEEASGLRADAERVRGLLQRHLPSAFAEEAEPGPVTVADVAAKLQADAALRGFAEIDLTANAKLLADATPLPDQLGQPQLERWAGSLNVSASPRYWKQFRQTAVMLRMSRCQTGAKLAAARQAKAKKEKPK
jgi:hypothetical protein